MLRFIKECLIFAVIATPAVQAAAGFNATDTLKASQSATSPMVSATSTAKSSVGLFYETIEAKVEVSTSMDEAGQVNVTVTCDDASLDTSLGHKLLRTRFPKKSGHSKSDDGDGNSSVCQEEEPADHLSTATIAGIIIGCIAGATIMATAIAIVIHLWRGDKSTVDVEKASGDASASTQVPFAKSFTTLLLATRVVQAAGAFNSTDSVEISQKDVSPTIVTVALSESTLGPSSKSPRLPLKPTLPQVSIVNFFETGKPRNAYRSISPSLAAAVQYNVTLTCNSDVPESYKVRSIWGKKGGRPMYRGGNDSKQDDGEDSLCQEPTSSPQLSTA
ncbi:hypothetical protein DL765_002600 [Monosporascus sp. GIB2]|nr:hypothetical protein DL765_002600 [Monosporascus sp. GIB2]